GDKAGIKAAEKSARLFLEKNLDSRVIVLPEGLDPDDYFKQYGPEDFQKLVDTAARDFDFLLERTDQTLRGEGFEYQKGVIHDLVSLTNAVKDPIKKELFLAKAAKKFNIEKGTLKQSVALKESQVKADEEYKFPVGPQLQYELPDLKTHEAKLIQYLLNQAQSIDRVRQYLVLEDFENPQLKELYSRILQLSEQEFLSLTPQDLPEVFVEFSSLIMHLLQNSQDSKTNCFSQEKIDQLVYDLKKGRIEYLLRQAGKSSEQVRSLTIEKLKLREQLKHLDHRKLKDKPKNRG
ncbi:MAG: hypothetical protein COB67_13400, partial [SAR324 cluster bacterium]